MEKTVIERNYCYVNQLKNYSTLFGVDRMMKSIKLRLQSITLKLIGWKTIPHFPILDSLI